MSYQIRNASHEDGKLMRWLAKECGTLDLHTPYTYWVNANYFAQSCFIMEKDGEPVGYLMAIDTPETVFAWQIGVKKEFRGQGLSFGLIEACVDYARSVKKNVEVTIAKENLASYHSFVSACKKLGLRMERMDEAIVKDLVEPSFEEVEVRYRISGIGGAQPNAQTCRKGEKH